MATDIQRREWFTADHSERNARNKGIRFQDFNEPPQFQFERLFRSTLFKLNQEDRARTTQAGHVILSTDLQIKNRTSIGGDVGNDLNFTNVVQPGQLPSAVAINSGSEKDDFPAQAIEVVATGTIRDDYTFRIVPGWLTKLVSRLFKRGGIAGDVLIKVDGVDYNYVPGDITQNSRFIANLGANNAIISSVLGNSTFFSTLLSNSSFITNLSNTIVQNNPAFTSEGLEVGFMRLHPIVSLPSAKWLRMDGSAISRSTYSTLFALIGTTYGTGDGTTTFNIPDFRDRKPIGYSGSKALASSRGTETHTIGSANLPLHNHSISGATGTTNSAGTHNHTVSQYLGAPTNGANSGGDLFGGTPAGAIPMDGAHAHTVTLDGGQFTGTGGFANDPINHLNPDLAVNFIIKVLP